MLCFSRRSSRVFPLLGRLAWLAALSSLASVCLQAQGAAQGSGSPMAGGQVSGSQDAGSLPAAAPAGTAAPLPPPVNPTAAPPPLSPRQAREAEDAYLAGARAIEHRNLAEAERHFRQAVALSPANRDYALALVVAREHRVTELVQQAAKARLAHDPQQADSLLNQARLLDPQNSVVLQHFGPGGLMSGAPGRDSPDRNLLTDRNFTDRHFADLHAGRADAAAALAGAPTLVPTPGLQSLHQRSSAPELLRQVYAAFGIHLTVDPSVKASPPIRFDLENADFSTAAEIVQTLTHTFIAPLSENTALAADNTQENRDRLQAQVEETIFLPGTPVETLNELATLARSVFDIRQVTPSPGNGTLLVRGEPGTLKLLNATYDSMLGGGSDIFLEMKLYEVDKTRMRNIGAVLPSSVGAFSIASEAQQLVSANQTVINQAIAQGVITLSGNSLTDLIREVGFLIASGVASSSQYTNLLGIVGGGLALTGVYLGSNASFNLLLNSSDVRMLDAVQLRAGDRQPSSFRVGTRYPVVTSTYSSGVSSSLASAAAGLSVNGTSVSSLLSQYLGTSAASVPQIQFEDLGLTLKTTPQVLRDGNVVLKLDLKLEALGGGTINNIPILNSRSLTSSVTVPAGGTALLVSQVSTNELRSLEGLPGLNELPGFGGTDRSSEKDTGELLITITPRVVRHGELQIISHPLSVPYGSRSTIE